MARHQNARSTAAEDALNQGRLAGGARRGTSARDYADHLGHTITGAAIGQAEATQEHWDRTGTPLWMRLKRAARGGRRG